MGRCSVGENERDCQNTRFRTPVLVKTERNRASERSGTLRATPFTRWRNRNSMMQAMSAQKGTPRAARSPDHPSLHAGIADLSQLYRKYPIFRLSTLTTHISEEGSHALEQNLRRSRYSLRSPQAKPRWGPRGGFLKTPLCGGLLASFHGLAVAASSLNPVHRAFSVGGVSTLAHCTGGNSLLYRR